MKKIYKYLITLVIGLLVIFLIFTLTALFEDCNNLSTFKCRFNPKCRVAWVPSGPNLPAFDEKCVSTDYQGDVQKSVYLNKKNYGRFELPQEKEECNTDSECFVGGCNGETCTARDDIETTCDVPEGMIGGLSCKCINKQCIWVKK